MFTANVNSAILVQVFYMHMCITSYMYECMSCAVRLKTRSA